MRLGIPAGRLFKYTQEFRNVYAVLSLARVIVKIFSLWANFVFLFNLRANFNTRLCLMGSSSIAKLLIANRKSLSGLVLKNLRKEHLK